MERVFGCDAGKRASILSERFFDLLAMAEVFADSRRLDYPDRRFDYGKERHITIGLVLGHIFTVVHTMRGPVTWLITAWPANRKERERYARR